MSMYYVCSCVLGYIFLQTITLLLLFDLCLNVSRPLSTRCPFYDSPFLFSVIYHIILYSVILSEK